MSVDDTSTARARRLCGDWMKPTGDAHYRDVKREIQALLSEIERLRKIAAHVPPMVYLKAKEEAGYGSAVKTNCKHGVKHGQECRECKGDEYMEADPEGRH